MVKNGITYTIHTDHLNTPRQLTNATKQLMWNWGYTPFGDNQPNSITTSPVFNLRYPGQYYDPESKLHYNINRYYDPAMGRYTQSDPIGLNGGINTYTYVGGNGVKYVDPSGLVIGIDDAIIIGVLAGTTLALPQVLDILNKAAAAAGESLKTLEDLAALNNSTIGEYTKDSKGDIRNADGNVICNDGKDPDKCDRLYQKKKIATAITDVIKKCKGEEPYVLRITKTMAWYNHWKSRLDFANQCFFSNDNGHLQAITDASKAFTRCIELTAEGK
jgi:RHS repeat-associated protein